MKCTCKVFQCTYSQALIPDDLTLIRKLEADEIYQAVCSRHSCTPAWAVRALGPG